MRFTPAAIGAAIILATFSTASTGAPTADYSVSALSSALVAQGVAAQKSGDLDQAADYYVSALAADPRNAAAYVALGQIAQARDLPGSAIRYYREALSLIPEYPDAIAGEGAALAQKGAITRAQASLARLKQVCGGNCPQIARVEAAIAKGPTVAAVAARADPESEPRAN
ncbi:MAG: hypothetical protein GW859_04805 [Sphingomonadales bacterium]|nr:hypothetical protein [Sphingomonadales bacterium]